MKLKMCLLLFIALTTMMSSTVSAQSSCTNVLISMAPCLSYISQNTSSPSPQCCSQLAHVVRYSPDCLCEVLDGGDSQLEISINETQALALPRACHVPTPPASRCNDRSSVNSHAGSSNTSETVPRDGPSSNGSTTKFLLPLLVILYTALYIKVYAIY